MATNKDKKTTTTGTKKKAPVKKATKVATAKKAPVKKAVPKKTTVKKGPTKSSFKKEMRSMLLENKKHLLADINQKIKQESDASKKEGDIYDIASSERERELTLMLGDRDRKKIQQVYLALEWLDEEEYGLCEECGEPIGDNRMRALPFTRVCVECKSKLEKNTLYKGRLDDGPLGMGDKSDSGEDVF